MKSYRHLFEICISKENRRRAIKNAKESKRIRKMIRRRHLSDDALLDESYQWIINYKNAEHVPRVIQDGIRHKERVIIVPTLEELIIQHCVVQALRDMFWMGMYQHTYASIPRRGAHKAKKVIEKWIDKEPGTMKYILKMDIRHFFDTVPHSILKAKLARKIHDEQMLDLLFKIIDVTDVGLPLGFYTSQWLSNWYLQEMDHYIKEHLHAKKYMRYMDDMIVCDSNKKTLHQIRLAISEYLGSELGLELKGDWQVFRFSHTVKGEDRGRPLDFMGFQFYRNRTVLRRSIMLKATRKARKIHKKPFHGRKPTVHDYRQMMSYFGWIDCTDTYRMYQKHIKPRVSFRAMRRYISKCDKLNERRVYEQLVRLYLPGGGRRSGTHLYSSRKRGATADP